ncbi:MAG: alpha-galactosidase [Oscillospiraceae bacterium]|nr:alpha-galactosidase [Oscillospiraceae bacterium]
MPIVYQEESKQFYLHTDHTSYVMELYEDHLIHSYWGSRVNTIPNVEYFYPFSYGVSTSAHDIPGKLLNSTDKLHREYPTYGTGDLREPALQVENAAGDSITRLRYESHRIYPGKPQLPGLPATYGQDCETLEIALFDAFSGVRTVLFYTVFPQKDVLTRSARIENRGDKPFRLEKAASFCVDMHREGFEVIHLQGAWARERHIHRQAQSAGTMVFDSKRGVSSHNTNPFIALVSPETTEQYGDAYGFCLVYSGSFSAQVSGEQFGSTRVQMGIQPMGFSWELAPSESFQTPEAILVYSDCGLGEMSRRFHRIIRENVCRGKFRDTERPVLINNWEATYFRFNSEKILALAEKAKQIGVDLLVLDDGWFGKRNSDNCSLGDWIVDRNKLPEGLEGLCNKVNDLGMQFGLWFEPEMVSPDSELYRAHPDWCIHVEGRPRTEGRQQLVLDLTRPEVCRYIVDAVSSVLRSCPISYVKWDMNRNLTEMPRKGFAHEYVLGLYRVLEEITSSFPDVLFESCSGGGGRFDAGMLYYMPQTWTSDDTDAVERLYIQEGTGLVYPISSMGAHISAVPNHQTGRTTPVAFRGKVAMMGRFGLELDLGRLDQATLDALAAEIALYKTYQQDIHTGDLYRLLSPYKGKTAAYQIISQKRVLVFIMNISATPCQAPLRLKLQGLLPEGRYKELSTGEVYEGRTLMGAGIPLDARGEYCDFLKVFEIL